MQLKIIENFTLGSTELESVANDTDFKVGFEFEFIAVPYGNKETNQWSLVDDLTYYQFMEAFLIERGRLETDIFDSFVEEYGQLLSRDTNFERLLPEIIEAYKRNNSNWRSFYTEEELQEFIRNLITVPAKRLNLAKEIVKSKGIRFMFNTWPKLKIAQIGRFEPRFGWANDAKTEVWTEAIGVSREEIKNSLRSKLGIEAKTGYDADSSRHWTIKSDASLRPDNRMYGEEGVEVTSPPLPMPQAIDICKKFFDWMHSRNYYTNNSCGFHVGVSYGSETGNLDPLKMAVLIGEDYVAKEFNRKDNRYALEHLPILVDKLKSNDINIRQFLKNKNTQEWIAELTPRILGGLRSDQKYRTINFLKLRSGYLEFRVAGGQGYDLNMDRVKKTVYRYAYVMKAALDPEAFKEDYYKKLYKLLLQAADTSSLNPGAEETAKRVDPLILSNLNKILPMIKNPGTFKEYIEYAIQGLSDDRSKPIATRYLLRSLGELITQDRKHRSDEGYKKVTLEKPTNILYKRIVKAFNVPRNVLISGIEMMPTNQHRIMRVFFGLE